MDEAVASQHGGGPQGYGSYTFAISSWCVPTGFCSRPARREGGGTPAPRPRSECIQQLLKIPFLFPLQPNLGQFIPEDDPLILFKSQRANRLHDIERSIVS